MCGLNPAVRCEVLAQAEYERPRMAESRAAAAALHGLQRTFSVSALPFALLRSAGLQAINVVPPARDALMRVAMGEPLPNLLPPGLAHLMPPFLRPGGGLTR